MDWIVAQVSREMMLRKQFVGASAALIPYLLEPTVTDILINGLETCFVERDGELNAEPGPFSNPGALQYCIERMLVPIGKQLDAAKPYLDGRLSDGTRFHIILPPLATPGPCISLRKHRETRTLELSSFCTPRLLEWLTYQVQMKSNLLIVGPTGAGKTTLLGLLVDHITSLDRVILIEETREVVTHHPHVIRLEARTASPDGMGGVSSRELFRNSLRMRPDRILVGECRGPEAFELLQALSSGHKGVMGTLHAEDAAGALRRLEALALLAGTGAPAFTLREWIASSVHAVVSVARVEGERQIVAVTEIKGLEGERYRYLPRPELTERNWRRPPAPSRQRGSTL